MKSTYNIALDTIAIYVLFVLMLWFLKGYFITLLISCQVSLTEYVLLTRWHNNYSNASILSRTLLYKGG